MPLLFLSFMEPALSTESTVLSQSPAPAEVIQPAVSPEGTGASEPSADDAQRASDAGRELAQHRKRNQENAFTRIQRRSEQLEQQNAQLTQAYLESTRQRQQPAQQPPEQSGVPTRDQFESYDDFVIAKAEHAAEKRVMDRLRTVAQEAQRAQGAQADRLVVQGHAQRVEQYARANPNFEAVITDAADVRLPEAASYAIQRMTDGPQILEAVAQNPGIAQALSGMAPEEQYIYLGQVSAALRQRHPQISRAPAPGTPVGQSSGASSDVRAMSRDQYWSHITKGWGGKKR
jgi:hypothetical protein